MTVEYDEDLAPQFARLLVKAADELSAPAFAADLAEGGATPGHVEMMADRWEEWDFEPPEFAGELREFAQSVHRLRAVS